MPSISPLASHRSRGTKTKSAIEGPSVFAIQPLDECATKLFRKCRCLGNTSELREDLTSLIKATLVSRKPNPNRAILTN